MVFQGGAFHLADGLSWNLGQGVDVRRRERDPAGDRDRPVGLSEAERRRLDGEWLWHLPLKTIDALEIRRVAPGYFQMLSHPSYDEYWKTFDVEARHDRFEVPAFHFTGWYDTLLTGTIRNFVGLRTHGRSARARDGQRLVIGPWTHARPTRASTKIGVLVYSTDPLSEPLEVTGPIEMRLWAASSAPDTDFTAKLVGVFPDGTARMLNDGILRARYRKSRTIPELLTPGRAEEFVIDVGATSNLFAAGHRIRVEISSSNFPRFDRNSNTGAPFGESDTTRPATQAILHDAGHPSRIVLPLVRR
jgi:predicted acyl esterase